MKKEKWVPAVAVGVGFATIAAVAYKLLSKDIPKGAVAVQPFDKNRYLGKWYEIARMPTRLEKGLKNLTETYSLNADGTMKVVTTAYNIKKEKWTELSGMIKFAGQEDLGMLKVSYFKPFYAAYNVLDIDPDYNYALVCSSGLGYLWILSRETTIPDNIRAQFLYTALTVGFATENLEWL
jgi:apolipoprotein D and lipocalin family protein